MIRLPQVANRLIARLASTHIVSLMAFGMVFCAVFIVPWFFPRSDPVAGESYALGFNNRLAVLGLILVICCMATFRALSPSASSQATATLNWFSKDSTHAIKTASKIEYAMLGVFSVLIAQVILWWDSVLVVPYWGEADYFLTRIDLVALGYRPYLDFHHNYGPLMLYGPLLLDWASGGSLGVESAYAWTVVAWTVLGVVGVFLLLRLLSIPCRSRPWVLAMSLLMWLPLTMGLNYTPLRFTAVPLSIALVHLLAQWMRTTSVSVARSNAALLALSAGVTALTFSISPEMGVADAAALITYSIGTSVRGDRLMAAAIMTGVCFSCLVMHWSFQGYFYGIRAFSAGANNFPILPNLHNVLLAVSAVVLISRLAGAVVTDPHHPNSPLAASIAIASGLMLFPSLGRCDPGHVILNSFTLILLWFPASATASPKLQNLLCATFFVAAVILNQASYWNHYFGTVKQALSIAEFYRANPATVQAWKDAWSDRRSKSAHAKNLNWRRTAPFPGWLEHPELSSLRIAAPVFADFGIDRFLKLQPRYVAPYHPCPKPEILTPASVAQAVADAESNDVLLLPEAYAVSERERLPVDKTQYEANINDLLSGLMFFPSRCTMHVQPYVPEIEVASQLMANGSVIGRGSGFVLIKPLDDAHAE